MVLPISEFRMVFNAPPISQLQLLRTISFQKNFCRLVHPLQLCFLFHPHAIKLGRQIQKTFTLIPNSVKPFLFTIASSNIRVCSYSSTSFGWWPDSRKQQTGWEDHPKCPCKTLRLINSEVVIYIRNRLWEKKTRFLHFYPPHAPPNVCMLLQFYVALPTTGVQNFPTTCTISTFNHLYKCRLPLSTGYNTVQGSSD
jgi:hypothetical protein